MTKETRLKMSISHTGLKHSDETKRKIISSLIGNKYSLGKKISEETRMKLIKNHKGMSGKKHSEITKIKMRNKKGPLTNNWRGGVSTVNQIVRSSIEYKLWRKSVFERDNYTCVWCKKYGGNIHADHIKSFAQHPDLRFAIDNGRTLCIECHKKTDNYCGKGEKRKNKMYES